MVLTDSMAKYCKLQNVVLLAFKGDTIKRLTDRIRFERDVDVSGYDRILIHVGSNDISNLVDSGRYRSVTIFDMLDRYKALRSSIRRRNSKAIILFSAILPRVERYELFRGYVSGLNFALEKWCAKTCGTCVFIPSFSAFIARGKPKAALFSEKDGLHLAGAGVDVLEGIFEQALSTGYLLTRINSGRTRMLKNMHL